LRFKTEVCLLSIAIALFAVSSFFYTYQTENVSYSLNAAASAESFPLRLYAVSFVGFGSLLMVTASVSYQKRSKELFKKIK
jgi:hypothetical protein